MTLGRQRQSGRRQLPSFLNLVAILPELLHWPPELVATLTSQRIDRRNDVRLPRSILDLAIAVPEDQGGGFSTCRF